MFGRSKPLPPAVAMVVDLLRDYPEEWAFLQYTARHTGGAEVYAHLDWTVSLTLPGLGVILRNADVGKASPAHKALLAAFRAAQAEREGAAAYQYLDRAAFTRLDRKRQLEEESRRADFEADNLEEAAVRLRRRSQELGEEASR